MPTIQGVTNVAAGASNPNVLQGSAFEYLPYHSKVDIAVVGDAAFTARASVSVGSDILMENSPISGQNRLPVAPDDYVLSDVGNAGDRLKIAVQNTSAGAYNIFWAARITPLV